MEPVVQEKGTLSIHTENIFPIIKKFLYSDHEIFLRELVSNAVDASQKVKQLSSFGEFNGELGELKVSVKLDKEAKTITVSDRGIGMTGDEIKKYINQIAFSGASEFVEKYKDKGDTNNAIIGHFGLGFYSAYMVAEKVEIITLSYKEGSEAVRWECDGSTEFSLGPADRTGRGTDICDRQSTRIELQLGCRSRVSFFRNRSGCIRIVSSDILDATVNQIQV